MIDSITALAIWIPDDKGQEYVVQIYGQIEGFGLYYIIDNRNHWIENRIFINGSRRICC